MPVDDCSEKIYNKTMIEFELKFRISTPPLVLNKFQKIKESSGQDFYYDTSGYDLIKGGNFLRFRNDKQIDFKLYWGDDEHFHCRETSFTPNDFHPNNPNLLEIFDFLGIKVNLDFTDFQSFIAVNNFELLAPIVKHRITYKIDNAMDVMVDTVDNLGNFMEAEMMLDESAAIDKAAIKKSMLEKLEQLNIIDKSPELVNIGYVELYLLENNKSAYDLGRYKI